MMDGKNINSDFLNRVVEVTKELSALIEKATDGNCENIQKCCDWHSYQFNFQ